MPFFSSTLFIYKLFLVLKKNVNFKRVGMVWGGGGGGGGRSLETGARGLVWNKFLVESSLNNISKRRQNCRCLETSNSFLKICHCLLLCIYLQICWHQTVNDNAQCQLVLAPFFFLLLLLSKLRFSCAFLFTCSKSFRFLTVSFPSSSLLAFFTLGLLKFVYLTTVIHLNMYSTTQQQQQ